MSNDNSKIHGSDDDWDSGKLGRDEKYVKLADPDLAKKIDGALDLHAISIRLQKSLIDDFKSVATIHGIGYQPLMRQVLKRFVDSEKKRILRERAQEIKGAMEKASPLSSETTERLRKQRKIA